MPHSKSSATPSSPLTLPFKETTNHDHFSADSVSILGPLASLSSFSQAENKSIEATAINDNNTILFKIITEKLVS